MDPLMPDEHATKYLPLLVRVLSKVVREVQHVAQVRERGGGGEARGGRGVPALCLAALGAAHAMDERAALLPAPCAAARPLRRHPPFRPSRVAPHTPPHTPRPRTPPPPPACAQVQAAAQGNTRRPVTLSMGNLEGCALCVCACM